MIDPPKATKGRRMSKKTRKKSPKTPARKAAPATSRTSAKKPAAKAGKAAAKKAVKPANPPGDPPRHPTRPPRKPPRRPKKRPRKRQRKRQRQNLHKARIETVNSRRAAPKSALVEGGKAPGFRLPRDGGDTVSLNRFCGKKTGAVFLSARGHPGLHQGGHRVHPAGGAFAESQTAVLGVSADPLKAQEAFRDKHELSTPLVSDEKHEMLDAYGVWGEKSMYGKTFHGILRTTVLIGKDGR